jgi:hypothetical protein
LRCGLPGYAIAIPVGNYSNIFFTYASISGYESKPNFPCQYIFEAVSLASDIMENCRNFTIPFSASRISATYSKGCSQFNAHQRMPWSVSRLELDLPWPWKSNNYECRGIGCFKFNYNSRFEYYYTGAEDNRSMLASLS